MKEFVRPYIIAGVVIKKDGKYLLVQEKKPEAYGLWNLPAGRLEVGETIKDLAVREAKEEAGFDVGLIRKIKVFQRSDGFPVHVFEAEISGGDGKFSTDEILDTKWFSLKELEEMKDKLRHSDWILDSINLVEGNC